MKRFRYTYINSKKTQAHTACPKEKSAEEGGLNIKAA